MKVQCRHGARRAFTLPEIMVVMAIFTMLVAAMIMSQMFGLRMHRISETKLGSTLNGRKAMNQVREEIRSGKILRIGLGDAEEFKNIPDNQPQIGNALQIYATTDTNSFVRYYLDPAEQSLKRLASTNAVPQIMASFITNQLVFQAEDFQGNVLTNHQNNRVIRLMLEFYRWEYPIAGVGSGSMYDYYRLQTRITRRMIE